LIVLRAKELPKGALVEYQVNLHTGRRGAEDVEGDDDDELEPGFVSGRDGQVWWETCKSGKGWRGAVFMEGDGK
jgi:diphthine-ammonia ligase